jgi:hypothetical protein
MQRDGESAWKMTLKEECFYFGSCRIPMIKPDSDLNDDPAFEVEAAFLTKIGAIEEGKQGSHFFNRGTVLTIFHDLNFWENSSTTRNVIPGDISFL